LRFLAALAVAQATDYKLTSWLRRSVGSYGSDAKPVLRIQPGDRVEILAMSTSSPAARGNQQVRIWPPGPGSSFGGCRA